MQTETVVTDTYISCRDQQINGRVYTSGEEIHGADALRTLPALLRTNRVRLATRIVEAQRPDSVDLGSANAKPKPKRAKR